MRLTAEMISNASQFLNALGDRELDLRGNGIAEIENLGATQDDFDTVDLSDNNIESLDNFPVLKRLRTLSVNNNIVTSFSTSLGRCLPYLRTLVLTNNSVKDAESLKPLVEIKTLERLSLIDNVVTKSEDYRLRVISILPQLRVLDFERIKQWERNESEKKYGSVQDEKNRGDTKTFMPGQGLRLTKEQKDIILNAISSSKSMNDVERYEQCLKEGIMPPELDK